MELSAYSAKFLAALLSAFPDFESHLKAGPEPGCFMIEFPSPSGSIFCVNTEEEDRITVGFDAHHCHFGGWAESDEEKDFENAVAYIRGLIDGRYEVAVWSRDGRFGGR